MIGPERSFRIAGQGEKEFQGEDIRLKLGKAVIHSLIHYPKIHSKILSFYLCQSSWCCENFVLRSHLLSARNHAAKWRTFRACIENFFSHRFRRTRLERAHLSHHCLSLIQSFTQFMNLVTQKAGVF